MQEFNPILRPIHPGQCGHDWLIVLCERCGHYLFEHCLLCGIERDDYDHPVDDGLIMDHCSECGAGLTHPDADLDSDSFAATLRDLVRWMND